MFAEYGWRAALAIVASNALYYLRCSARRLPLWLRTPPAPDVDRSDEEVEGERGVPLLPVPAWITVDACPVHGVDGVHRA